MVIIVLLYILYGADMDKSKRKWHPVFRVFKRFIRIFFPVYEVDGTVNVENDNPSVFVCNHSEINGPVAMGLFFPFIYRPWVIHDMTKFKSCVRYIEKDFVKNKLKLKGIIGKIVTFFTAFICSNAIRGSEGIPVYRESFKIFKTYKQSVESILKGYSIVIFPEEGQKKFSKYINDFYRGFVHLARKVYTEAGMKLSYYPVYIDRVKKKITIGKSETYTGNFDYKEERERIVRHLLTSINDMADRSGQTN